MFLLFLVSLQSIEDQMAATASADPTSQIFQVSQCICIACILVLHVWIILSEPMLFIIAI